MKKKILIATIILLILVITLGIMYAIDMYMMDNNKPVIFSTWGYDYAPPEIIGNVINIVDKTKENNNFACATALEKIFEDEKNEYFLSCIKSEHIIVKYEKGYEEDIKSALRNGTITIQDLDRFNIDYIIKEKEIKSKNSFVATIVEKIDNHMIVEPNINESERNSADRIVINYSKNETRYEIGSKIVVCYSSGIMETYPAGINADSISLLD